MARKLRVKNSNCYPVESASLLKRGVENLEIADIKYPTSLHASTHEIIKRNIITFLIGPAGCGKTFSSIHSAVCALKLGSVKRIVITRPAVTAFESHGYLPGTLEEKMYPLLLPIYDELTNLVGKDFMQELISDELIEVSSISYMRGRTFRDAFVIADEIQNCTEGQLKMILTRLGQGSKMVLTGDPSQSDLSREVENAFGKIWHLLDKKITGIASVQYNREHIVRPKIVSDLLEAFEDNS